MTRALLAGIALLLLSRPLAAASSGLYLELLRAYPAEPDATAKAVLLLAAADLDAGVEACLRPYGSAIAAGRVEPKLRCSPRELMSAAMMHGDAAEMLMGAGRIKRTVTSSVASGCSSHSSGTRGSSAMPHSREHSFTRRAGSHLPGVWICRTTSSSRRCKPSTRD